MAADGADGKKSKVVVKKRLSRTPTGGKKVSSKKVSTKKSVKKPARIDKDSKSSASVSSRSSALSQSSGKLRSESSVAVQKDRRSKQSSQKQPMVVNLNLSLNFVMPDGVSSGDSVGRGLTVNLNDILNQQQAEASSASRHSASHSVVKGKLTKNKKSVGQMSKSSKKVRSTKISKK